MRKSDVAHTKSISSAANNQAMIWTADPFRGVTAFIVGLHGAAIQHRNSDHFST
jgi:hypothetical protein